jgi:hypothetical protein
MRRARARSTARWGSVGSRISEDTLAKKPESTIENRVYLFKDMAQAFLAGNGRMLASTDPQKRSAALRALGDIAHAASVMADSAGSSPDEVRERIARGNRS